LKNWHLLFTWLAFTIKGLDQGWLAQCQFNVTGWGIIFIKSQLESGPVTANLTTTVVHTSKLLINDVKPDSKIINGLIVLKNVFENRLFTTII